MLRAAQHVHHPHFFVYSFPKLQLHLDYDSSRDQAHILPMPLFCGRFHRDVMLQDSLYIHVKPGKPSSLTAVSYTHLRAHETPEHLVCRLLLEKKKKEEESMP